jgi:ABC-type multidrug transport system fused ATPase/permease subunit
MGPVAVMPELSNEAKNCKRQFYQRNKLNFAVTLLFQILVSLMYISLAFFLMTIIDSMEKKDTGLFFRGLIYIAAIVIAFLIFSALLKRVKNAYIKKGLSRFKKYIFEKILGKTIEDFNRGLSGKIISVFSNDLNSIESNYLNGTVMIINYTVMFSVTAAAMAYISLTIVSCVLVVSIAPIAVSLIFGKKLMRKEKETSVENEGFVDQVADLLGGFFVIKSFKAEKEVIDLFGNQNFILEEAKLGRRDAND